MFWNLHVVVRKSPLKQPREHLLSHTKFSDSLNIVCATFAQASYLTQLAWLEKICIGLSQLTNELQKENILILKLIIKSFSKPFLCRWKRLITVRDVYCMFNWVSSQWVLTYWTLYEQENRYQAPIVRRVEDEWRHPLEKSLYEGYRSTFC